MRLRSTLLQLRFFAGPGVPSWSLRKVFLFISINHYSYSDYPAYNERPHPTGCSSGLSYPGAGLLS